MVRQRARDKIATDSGKRKGRGVPPVPMMAPGKEYEMLRVVFVVCLTNDPGTCREHEIPVYDPIPLMACMTGAMPELANWRATHPNWRIAKWRCEDDRVVLGN